MCSFMWGAKQTLSHSCSLNFMLRVWVLGCAAQQGHREWRSSTVPFPEQHYCSDNTTIQTSFQPKVLRGSDLGQSPQDRDLFVFSVSCYLSVEITFRDILKETTDTKIMSSCLWASPSGLRGWFPAGPYRWRGNWKRQREETLWWIRHTLHKAQLLYSQLRYPCNLVYAA